MLTFVNDLLLSFFKVPLCNVDNIYLTETYPIWSHWNDVIFWSSVLLLPSNSMLSSGSEVSMVPAVRATGGVFCSERGKISTIQRSYKLSSLTSIVSCIYASSPCLVSPAAEMYLMVLQTQNSFKSGRISVGQLSFLSCTTHLQFSRTCSEV